MANNNFSDILKLIDNEYATVAEDGTFSDIAGFIDTGSYSLNALLSGSIFKGMPANKITAFAGEESVGKSWMALAVLQHFLNTDKKALGMIFESEGALTKEILEERNIDTSRVLIIPVETVQQFKTQAIRIVENYLQKSEKDRKPLLLILDSLGMLSTTKEMADTESGKEVKDMTRTQEIKAAFRVLTLKLSKAKIPMLITNHVYQTMGMFPTKEVAGGSGLKYAASTIIAMNKSKDKDKDGNLIGVNIRCKTIKSRVTKEGAETRFLLSFNKGLDRYFGLLDLAIEHGIFKKVSTKIELPDGTTHFESHINKNADKFFTKEILKQIDEAAKKEYCYGMPDPDQITEELLNGEENE